MTFFSDVIHELFQFHKGTIKTYYEKNYALRQVNFNSIKVRLKLIVMLNITFRDVFQFHKGTIKTTISTKEPA